jgi:hypothetical protein
VDFPKIRETHFFILYTETYNNNAELLDLLLKKIGVQNVELSFLNGGSDGAFFKFSIRNSVQKSRKASFSPLQHDYMYNKKK